MSGSLRVSAVLVTYGDRWHLLNQVLEELARHDARLTAIVVVDNGSRYDLRAKLRDGGFERVSHVAMNENTGSASGFAAGISYAVSSTSPDFVWLLDDDNKPSEGCLRRLLLMYEELGADRNIVLVALRKSRTEQLAVLNGHGHMCVRPNSFLGFHLRELPQKVAKLARRQRRGQEPPSFDRPLIPIRYAPYGGLLFHASWVARVGVPDERFYVYGDDHEFTGRMTDAGGRIFLLTSGCEIFDLEVSWSVAPTRAPPIVSMESSPSKVFYVVRNRVYWEWSKHVTHPSLYFLNLVCYLALLSVRALLAERAPLQLLQRYILISRAVRYGLAGELGKVQSP